MGKNYEEPFRRLVTSLGPSNLSAFIDDSQVHPKYREHIASTLTDLCVDVVDTADVANFIVHGYVIRESDNAIGLAIHGDSVGAVALFPDAQESPTPTAA